MSKTKQGRKIFKRLQHQGLIHKDVIYSGDMADRMLHIAAAEKASGNGSGDRGLLRQAAEAILSIDKSRQRLRDGITFVDIETGGGVVATVESGVATAAVATGAPADVTPNAGYVRLGSNSTTVSGGGLTQEHRDKAEGIFRCDSSDVYAPCPIAKIPTIEVPASLWHQLVNLTKDIGTEWFVYLTGELDGGVYTIEEAYFPPQVVTGAHVEVDTDFQPRPRTIGALHSHVAMGAFFSAEDMAHSNWDVEIVINRKGEYKAIVRQRLECGKWAKNDSQVFLLGDNASDILVAQCNAAIAEGGKKQAARKAKEPPSYKYGGGYGFAGGYASHADRDNDWSRVGGTRHGSGHPKSNTTGQEIRLPFPSSPISSSVGGKPKTKREELELELPLCPLCNSKREFADLNTVEWIKCRRCNIHTMTLHALKIGGYARQLAMYANLCESPKVDDTQPIVVESSTLAVEAAAADATEQALSEAELAEVGLTIDERTGQVIASTGGAHPLADSVAEALADAEIADAASLGAAELSEQDEAVVAQITGEQLDERKDRARKRNSKSRWPRFFGML